MKRMNFSTLTLTLISMNVFYGIEKIEKPVTSLYQLLCTKQKIVLEQIFYLFKKRLTLQNSHK